MAFTVVVAGSAVQLIFSDGSIRTLTLPSGIGVIEGRPARFAILDRSVIITNCFNQPLWIDPLGNLYPLSVPPPAHEPTVSAGSAGALTGDFKVRVSFAIKDQFGDVLLETELGPASGTVTVASQFINVATIQTSQTVGVNCRRVYRTADGPGASYFLWFELDNNTTTTFSDDASDESLSTLPASEDLGTAPRRIAVITEWKGSIWAVDADDPDKIRYSAPGVFYGYPSANAFNVRPIGKDAYGVVGFMPRRDELGVAKRNFLWKVIGENEDDYALRKLVEGKDGEFIFVAPDSCVIVKDVARWLGSDGVYAWGPEGVSSVTDAAVRKWFTTDDYFNRARFPFVTGRYEPKEHAYQLLMALAGSSLHTHWISLDIATGKWWGPHKTDLFTPTCAGVIVKANDNLAAALGSDDGNIYAVTPGTYRDGAATAIALDGQLHPLNVPDPDLEHYYGEIFVHSKVLAGGTLTITPKVGGLNASAQAAISHSLTTGRERMRRIGVGRLCQLALTDSTVNREEAVYALEIPWHPIGRR